MEVERQILGPRASNFPLPIGKNTGAGVAAPGSGTPNFAAFINQHHQQQQYGAMAVDPSTNK